MVEFLPNPRQGHSFNLELSDKTSIKYRKEQAQQDAFERSKNMHFINRLEALKNKTNILDTEINLEELGKYIPNPISVRHFFKRLNLPFTLRSIIENKKSFLLQDVEYRSSNRSQNQKIRNFGPKSAEGIKEYISEKYGIDLENC
jgi:hypothetical protein